VRKKNYVARIVPKKAIANGNFHKCKAQGTKARVKEVKDDESVNSHLYLPASSEFTCPSK
jgi:hypothetical protein